MKKATWADVRVGDNVAAVSPAYGRMGPGTKDSKGVIAIHPKTEKTCYGIEMDGGWHFFPDQDRLTLIIRDGVEIYREGVK